MIGFPLGLLYANAGEWIIHKYVLHGVGKDKKSFWNFHWGEHHRASRKNDFHDPDYERSPIGAHAQGKEALGIAGLMLLHAPLLPVAPYFTAAVWYSGANYFLTHRKAHLNPAWAKRHLRHHYDHHMGSNQDANWCVTKPWFDHLMGTRIPYEYDEHGRVRKDVRPPAAPRHAEEKGESAPLAATSNRKVAA
jgi:hypothetical protein